LIFFFSNNKHFVVVKTLLCCFYVVIVAGVFTHNQSPNQRKSFANHTLIREKRDKNLLSIVVYVRWQVFQKCCAHCKIVYW